MVGLRYDVGADWPSYQFLFKLAGSVDLRTALRIGDPGYQLINWTVYRLGLGLWAVNLICASVVSWGLLRFARAQPDPWIALVVAVPYFITVVAMGYTRQAVAIAIIMAGLESLNRGSSMRRFAVYVLFALLFHRTAVVVLPIVILAADRNRFLNVLLALSTTYFLYDLFLASSMDDFVKHYIVSGYNSQGAAIRVAMNLVPATIFLAARKHFEYLPQEEKIWRNFSFASILLLALLLISPSSTIVDRLALYIIPLQLAVFSRTPSMFNNSGPVRFAIVAYSAILLFVFLNFAKHAQYWLPYRFYPFE